MPDTCKRLYENLAVKHGKQQFVLTGKTSDFFMVNLTRGIKKIEDALLHYAIQQDYDIAFVLNVENGLLFAETEMEEMYNGIIKKSSVNPDSVPGSIKRRVSQVPSPQSLENDSQTQQATQQVRSNTPSALQQRFDEILNRLLPHPVKSFVVLTGAEKVLEYDGRALTPESRKRLETIRNWAKVEFGNPETCTLLIVNEARIDEFNEASNFHVDGLKDITMQICVGTPDVTEIEAFLLRFIIKQEGEVGGDPRRIARMQAAKNLTLYNVFETMKRKRHVLGYMPNDLEHLFADDNDKKPEQILQDALQKLHDLTGLGELKAEFKQIEALAEHDRELRRQGQKTEPISYHMYFLGKPGTGKTMAARLVGKMFWGLKLLPSQAFVEVKYQDIISAYNEGDTVQNMVNKIREASGGVLFVDEFYLFAEHPWGRQALNALMTEMENNRDSFVVIMAGYKDKLQNLYKVNAGFESRVNRKINFADYTVPEMIQIFEGMVIEENKMVINDEAKTKLSRYIDSFARRGDVGNGRGVRNLFEKMKKKRASRKPINNEILPEDLPDPIMFREAEVQAIIEKLEQFVGIPRVKKFFNDIFLRQRGLELQGETITGTNHCMFLGYPGTGKTSVARLMGNLFYALGLISEKDECKEVGLEDFTSTYAGGFAEKVRDVFSSALGGVLFIDEAYRLAKDEQGLKILDQIVQMMTNPAFENLVVVMAGYPNDMQELYKANPGLKRRIAHEVYFDNFTPEELKQIFYKCMEDDSKAVADSDKDLFDTRLQAILGRKAMVRNFGNAGDVVNFYRDIVKPNLLYRVSHDPSADKFLVEDLTGREAAKSETTEDILAELEREFIGMTPVKEKLRKISLRIQMDKRRAEVIRKVTTTISPGRYNMRFIGNPGTGKTTIARYMARVFYSLGVLEHPRYAEVRGTDLQGSFEGQTKDAVNALFEKHAGCVIVIDEAYSLFSPYPGHQSTFGQEAIDTLVGNITDPCNATTIVVIAGYRDRMDAFLLGNPGLASRFGMEIEFPDYSDDECVQILRNLIKKEEFDLQEGQDIDDQLVSIFANLRSQSGSQFGNARTVGSVFDAILENLDERTYRTYGLSGKELVTILPEDIPWMLNNREVK